MQNETIVTIGGLEYSIGRLDTINQFHVARHLAPFFTKLVKVAKDSPEAPTPASETEIADPDKSGAFFIDVIAGPLATILAEMQKETCESIIFTCLEVVKRKIPEGGWAPVSNRKQLMYADMELPTMMQLVVAVIQKNLGNFMNGVQLPSLEAK